MKKWLHLGINLLIVALMLVLDQFTKYLAVMHLKNNDPISIIKNVFELYYLENRGAAFGILQGKKIFFVVITIILICVLVIMLLELPAVKKFVMLRGILIFFIAGAIGNLIDRISHQYVVDFFYFRLIDFPVFNMADIYVTLAAIGFILSLLFYYKEEDLNQLFSVFKRKKNS